MKYLIIIRIFSTFNVTDRIKGIVEKHFNDNCNDSMHGSDFKDYICNENKMFS